MWVDERGSEVLSVPECRRLLALGAKQHRAGHLGIPEDGAPTVLPVDYSVDGPDVVVRVGEGLFEHLVDKLVAFEVEGEENGSTWSVLVRGLAVGHDPRRLAGAGPAPRVALPGHRIVVIRSDALTGRRLGPAPRPRDPSAAPAPAGLVPGGSFGAPPTDDGGRARPGDPLDARPAGGAVDVLTGDDAAGLPGRGGVDVLTGGDAGPAPARPAEARRAPGPAPLPAGLGAALPDDPTWCVSIGSEDSDLDPADRRATESLLCLSDGAIGTRAALEEDREAGPSVLAAGLYEPSVDGREALLPLPAWFRLPLRDDLPAGRRVLDLRDGVLRRSAARPEASLTTVRFACAAHPGVAVMAAETSGFAWPEGPPAPGEEPPASAVSRLGGGAVSVQTTSTRTTGAGGPASVERLAAYSVSASSPPDAEGAARRLRRAAGAGVVALLAEQRREWAQRWAAADVEVVGDPETTLAARFALFHLMSSANHHGEAAVGARGLTGSAYAGHVMWDTDVFVTPVLAAVDPGAARAVLEYRIRRLRAARARAEREGRAGARFPWESAADGDDVTPGSGLDQHGKRTRIRTGQLEEHVSADVAWSAWAYASWTGSKAFLGGPGRDLLTDTARYWDSRVREDRTGGAHIDSVIGPDEYHENVDDNAFTNVMARWNLRRAAEVVERSDPTDEQAEEAGGWARLAERIVDGFDPATRLYEQFCGYFQLDPAVAPGLGRRPVAADLILGAERLTRSQIVKQADVMMAYHLVPGEMAPRTLASNLDYYLPRTAHGSSLSPSVHAGLLARAGRPDDALGLLRVAAAIDMDDLTETTAGGLHLANLGGIWGALVGGFAGVRPAAPDSDCLAVDPVLPDDWRELRVRLTWRGRRIRLDCRNDAVWVRCHEPLNVTVNRKRVRVEPPGRWVG